MTRRVLAFCPDYNGYAAHFMMRADDERLDGVHYIKVADAVVTGPSFILSGQRVRALRASNGTEWLVFADWSCREKGGE